MFVTKYEIRICQWKSKLFYRFGVCTSQKKCIIAYPLSVSFKRGPRHLKRILIFVVMFLSLQIL